MENENQIRLTIDGSEVTLAPSAHAATELSRRYGGLLPLTDHINAGSLEAATDVLFFSLGKKDSERARLREQAYSAGLAYLAPHLVNYTIRLMNGGKAPNPQAPNPQAPNSQAPNSQAPNSQASDNAE